MTERLSLNTTDAHCALGSGQIEEGFRLTQLERQFSLPITTASDLREKEKEEWSFLALPAPQGGKRKRGKMNNRGGT